MRKNLLFVIALCSSALAFTDSVNAQTVVIDEECIGMDDDIQCKDHYYSTWRNNWFIEMGAGVNSPFVENYLLDGGEKHHLTAVYNLGFGKWMSPYLGWRMSMYHASIHWDDGTFSKAKYGNVNFDLMWDMCNSLGGVNPGRPVSVVPYVGLGGAFTWDFKAPEVNVVREGTEFRKNSWTLPVSAGVQLRFRLCRYADFFLEGRAWFYGDNFNNTSYGQPVDVNIAALGGFNINIGGSNFRTYNPCNDLEYISTLNGQINSLRGDLAVAAAALAAAESQLPCPEVVVQDCPEVAETAPMLTTVRFAINSAEITADEMVNVFNVAEYMKANPDMSVVIKGYADKDTGTAAYNMQLSEKRAQAVFNMLTQKYGVSASRLTTVGVGSDTQIYDTNNWNRIVIFVPAD